MGKERNREDLQWIQAVLKGETQAFVHLVDQYKDFVYTLAFNLLKQREEAEEAAQDTFMKAFHALPRFRQDAKFSTWLYRIVYNECITRLRKQKVRLPLTGDLDEQRVGENPDAEEFGWREREEQYRKLHRAIRKLSESDRAVVILYYFEKLPMEEISSITTLSITNVKTKLFRARKKLYGQLMCLTGGAVSRKGENRL